MIHILSALFALLRTWIASVPTNLLSSFSFKVKHLHVSCTAFRINLTKDLCVPDLYLFVGFFVLRFCSTTLTRNDKNLRACTRHCRTTEGVYKKQLLRRRFHLKATSLAEYLMKPPLSFEKQEYWNLDVVLCRRFLHLCF